MIPSSLMRLLFQGPRPHCIIGWAPDYPPDPDDIGQSAACSTIVSATYIERTFPPFSPGDMVRPKQGNRGYDTPTGFIVFLPNEIRRVAAMRYSTDILPLPYNLPGFQVKGWTMRLQGIPDIWFRIYGFMRA